MPAILVPLLQANVTGPTGTDLTSGATSFTATVVDGASTPETPFFAYLEQGTSREERILVTGIAGTAWTVARGQLGTTAVAHPYGAAITAGLERDDLLDLFSRLELPYPDPLTLAGVKTWNFDPAIAAATSAGIQGSGRIVAIKIPLKRKTLITNLIAQVQTAGVTLTAGQNLAALYDSSGVLIPGSVTGDQSGVWTSTGVKTMAIAGGPILVDPGPKGFVWLALLTVGTTPPIWRAGSSNTGVVNFATPTNEKRSAQDAATGLTAMPASLTPSTMATWELMFGALS